MAYRYVQSRCCRNFRFGVARWIAGSWALSPSWCLSSVFIVGCRVIKHAVVDIISVGNRVHFENDHGPQVGKVVGILRNISNAQPFAIVEIEDILSGILISVAMSDLVLMEPTA